MHRVEERIVSSRCRPAVWQFLVLLLDRADIAKIAEVLGVPCDIAVLPTLQIIQVWLFIHILPLEKKRSVHENIQSIFLTSRRWGPEIMLLLSCIARKRSSSIRSSVGGTHFNE